MDLEIIESRSGGDLVAKKRDVSVIEGFENMPYLAMFGGNTEQSTPLTRIDGQQAFDWWGNNLFFLNDQSKQMNSLTERTLNSIALNSAGRLQIEEAIKQDLQFMSSFANVDVSVSIIGPDAILIGIRISKPENLSQQTFAYIWDATISELIELEVTGSGQVQVPSGGIFSFEFDHTFN